MLPPAAKTSSSFAHSRSPLSLSLSLSHIPTLCSLLSQCFICWPISCPFFRMILTKAKLANTCVHKYAYMCVCVNMYRCACVHSMYLRMCKRLVHTSTLTSSNNCWQHNNNKALLVFAAFSLCIFA